MRTEEMRLKVTTLTNRLSRLHHSLDQLSPRDRQEFPEMVGYLQHALEELCAADEELQTQNLLLREPQQKLDEERGDYRELFEEAPFGYVMTDSQGAITHANRAIHELMMVPEGYLEEKRLTTILAYDIHPAVHSMLCQFCDASTKLTRGELQTSLLRRGKEMLPVVILARLLRRQEMGLTMVGWTICGLRG